MEEFENPEELKKFVREFINQFDLPINTSEVIAETGASPETVLMTFMEIGRERGFLFKKRINRYSTLERIKCLEI